MFGTGFGVHICPGSDTGPYLGRTHVRVSFSLPEISSALKRNDVEGTVRYTLTEMWGRFETFELIVRDVTRALMISIADRLIRDVSKTAEGFAIILTQEQIEDVEMMAKKSREKYPHQPSYWIGENKLAGEE